MNRPARRAFDLRLVDAGTAEDGDVFLRLRAALKRLLRGYALRCARVVEAAATADGPDPTSSPFFDPPEGSTDR